MRKKIFAVALCLLMVMMLPMSVLAAQETNLIKSVQIEGPRMTMICSGVAGVHGKYEVTIDGQRVSVNNSTAHASQVPMTFFCMVDTSGSIRLRVILDRNSAEVFVNDGEKTLTMTLVTPVAAEGIAFEANGGAAMDVTLHELEHN
mgnify:CR=1 FL=1